jgi:hypothetical protein
MHLQSFTTCGSLGQVEVGECDEAARPSATYFDSPGPALLATCPTLLVMQSRSCLARLVLAPRDPAYKHRIHSLRRMRGAARKILAG